MSRAKELKTNPENNINMFDLFSLFVPEGKSKYTEILFRLLKKTPNINEHRKEIIERLSDEFNISAEQLSEIPILQLVFFYRLIDSMFNSSDMKAFQKFCEYNERGLIRQNDLSRYSTFEDIINSLTVAEMTAATKEMEKQVSVIMDDEEWLVLRPLTFEASRKYGANTKWCTTQENNPEYFLKYSKRGVLVYTINKKTGYKVATFYSLDKSEAEYSWWNQKDTRIDSLEAEITQDIRIAIHNVCTDKKAKTNRFLLGDDERIKEEKLLSKSIRSLYPTEEIVPVQDRNIRRGRINRVLEREDEVVGETDTTEPSPEMDSNDMEAPNIPAFSSSSFRL